MNTTKRKEGQQRTAQQCPTLLATALYSLCLLSFAISVYGAPQGGVIRAGQATIAQSGPSTLISQSSDRAIIDWRSFNVGAREAVQFKQPGKTSATLNRVTGEQLSMILGRLDANGQILLINPHGIVFGQGAQVNVGSLIASTANLSNANFMAGRLHFDQPGQPGAGIINQGTLSAADGGLIALVAPHVRNDGLIQARLGKVLLGAGDTFTLDLYGDGLINLAVTPEHGQALLDATGQPIGSLITHTGRITADGGQVVLITAPAAKAVLDQVINLSGTIQADTIAQQSGHIVLLGQGGRVDVSGTLSAQGTQPGQNGGTIDLLGDSVHLASGARLDASGHSGGGTIHIGGAFQGQGTTYRAQTNSIDTGAQLNADATANGHGGEVIVWADGHTAYAGEISARGGPQGGDGGRVEVSGKGSLDFQGSVDAGAPHGTAGSLLLDPAYLNIGLAEAGLISRVLRTGTSTTLAADIDINVNARIDGRGRRMGGGLTLNAGHDINVNDFIITHNGLINLLAAGGTVNMAPGTALFAGNAPITVRTGGTFSTGSLITTGALNIASTGGSVNVNSPIDANTRAVAINAAHSLTVNQPILNLRSGSSLALTAGEDLVVNAQIDGRGGVAGGTATLAAGNNATINSFIITNNGPISIDAARGNASLTAGAGLYAGSAPITVSAGNNIATGNLVTSGPLSALSRAGSITVSAPIDGATGPVTLNAENDVVVAQSIVNSRSDAPLTIAAGRDILVNAQIDGRDADPASASGSINLTAGRNVELAKSVITENAALNVEAHTGTVKVTNGNQLRSGSGNLTATAGSDLYVGDPLAAKPNTDTPYITSGTLNVTSAGNLFIEALIPDSTGTVNLVGGDSVWVNERIYSNNEDINITAGAGGIVMSASTIMVPTGELEPYDTRQVFLSDTDARMGNLTLLAQGHIRAPSVHTAGSLSITSTSGNIHGTADKSRGGNYQGLVGAYPQRVLLSAGGRISFNIWYANDVEAVSSGGTIYLTVVGADRVRVTALSPDFGDVTMGVPLSGSNVVLSAGRDVSTSIRAGNASLTAGRDVNLGYTFADSLNMSAGRDINFSDLIWLNWGDLSATAGRNIMATDAARSNIHITGGYSVDGGYSVEPSRSATFVAGGSIALRKIETLGDVNITANTGDITLNAPVGPTYQPPSGCLQHPKCPILVLLPSYPRNNQMSEVLTLQFLPLPDQGVASLLLSAPVGAIDMAGVRTVGIFDAGFGSGLVSSSQINGSNSFPGGVIQNAPIQSQEQLWTQLITLYGTIGGPIAPGPLPTSSHAANRIFALLPIMPSVPVLASASEPGMLSSPSVAERSEIGTVASQAAHSIAQAATLAGDKSTQGNAFEPVANPDSAVLLFSGGRGIAQAADLGRAATIGAIPEVFLTTQANEDERRRNHDE